MNLPESGFGFGGHALDAGVIAHIEFERQRAAAEVTNFRFEFGEGFAMAAGEDQVCSRFGQCASEILAEAAAGTGDQGDLAGEVEERVRSCFGLRPRGENDLHQIWLMRVKALEPARAFCERRDGGDEGLDLNHSAADEVDGLRIFS